MNIKIICANFLLTLLFFGCIKNNRDKLITNSNPKFNDSLNYGSLVDHEGNHYKTIKIGDQIWMAENLRVTKTRDGKDLKKVDDGAEWSQADYGAYCCYENECNPAVWGYLYNYQAISDNEICPKGGHIPTDSDWGELINFLKGDSIAGGKIKESGWEHWRRPNGNANNRSGFTALPGGMRTRKGTYTDINTDAYFWSLDNNNNYKKLMAIKYYPAIEITCYMDKMIRSGYDKNEGLSVRCIKDK